MKDGLVETQCRFAGGSGQHDLRMGIPRHVKQQRQNACYGGCLAGTRPAGNNRKPMGQGHPGGRTLQVNGVVLRREIAVKSGIKTGFMQCQGEAA